MKFVFMQGQKMYYHRIIVEEAEGQRAGFGSKHTITVKCSITEVVVQQPNAVMTTNHTVFTRSVLPEDFEADA